MTSEAVTEWSELSVEFARRDPLVFDDSKVLVGDRVVVTGRSGSGKSTLLSLIAGLRSPTSGQLHVLGVEAGHRSHAKLFAELRRDRMAVIPQGPMLVGALTVEENLRLVVSDSNSSDIANMLDIVGLGRVATSYPHELSGGEAQRVTIARALAMEPTLIVADEPTSFLDDAAADIVHGLLSLDVGNRTVIVATHDDRFSRSCTKSIDLD